MHVSARVDSSQGDHTVQLTTEGRTHPIVIPPKADGFGSSVSGGELLFLALATCYCNDLYREAKKRDIDVRAVEVVVEGEFGAAGEPARNITYRARVESPAHPDVVAELMRFTDSVAEIQNTLRGSVSVVLTDVVVA